ncbi:hypothetical protein Acsp04_33680 [Actinomadura sp. NBRC 104425]|nr:hypothetical protein Acsp04_33680 [Actinomadura sp. NBRC 104425]
MKRLGRGLRCSLVVTLCALSLAYGDARVVRRAAPARPACDDTPGRALPGRGALRRTGEPGGPGDPPVRDRADLPPAQVRAMLDDYRRTLRARFGTDDERLLEARWRRRRVVIPVRFHVVTDGRSGRLSRATAKQQVATLNAAYGGRWGGADTGIRFRLQSYDVTVHPGWFAHPHAHERDMKHRLRGGGPGTLNLFTAAVGTDVLGFSTFPQWYRGEPDNDGVIVDHRSVTNGSLRHFDRGYTVVHEVGHWIGLFHTFENGCEVPGDDVGDTPYEAWPAQGCPRSKDTCPEPGSDPVRNFMNYGWDDCMREFTAGQGRRLRTLWAAYREPRRTASARGGARFVGESG